MATLGFIPNAPLDTPPIPMQAPEPFDWSARLSIDMIRTHTKTDDVPAVADAQLQLYRGSAIEAAEQYTGMLLTGQRTISEPIEGPRTLSMHKTHYSFTLQYPVADGLVYLYGGSHINDNGVFRVPLGTRKIKVPIRKDVIDLSNCCDPCAKWAVNGGMLAMYRAGFRSPAEVPDGVVHGMLQYIAWAVDHPGDELLTQRNRVETRAGLSGLQGSNNIAMISGALETWRRYDPEAY